MIRPTVIEDVPRCPHVQCGVILTAVPTGGCGEPDFQCPVKSAWPHGIDQSALGPQHRFIAY